MYEVLCKLTMLYQVNKILIKRLLITCIKSNKYGERFSSTKVLYPLEHRRLIKVYGNDSSVFLQGLITNDMNHFEAGAKTMFAVFLNNKGRVLYDTLIHKWQDEDSFMIECDHRIIDLLKKHLNLFKLKRSVKVDVNNNHKVWVLLSPELQEKNVSISNVNIYKDPRLVDLGFRIIAESSLNGLQIAETIGKDITIEKDSIGYKYLRYKLGVSEGAEDLPPGSTFPLEVNCDYLHGVSFHKGCYIGQELTARVHHTGVVRKRIMPLKFNEELEENVEIDTTISATDNPKSNLGKLKGFVHDYGIGLVRIKEVLDAKVLNVGKYSAEIIKPTWWPIEAPKEKTNIKVE